MKAYDSDNIFAKILRGEIPCNKIYEDEHALCFHDVAPQAPVHALIIPKGSYRSFSDFATKASNVEREGFFQAVHKCAQLLQLEEGGYRLLANHGADARQEVSHFLVHVCGGGKLGKLVTIP